MAGADPYMLRVLDYEFRYPTPMAAAKGANIVLPGQSDWDGWARLLQQPKTMAPWFPTGLLVSAIYHCQKFGYQFQVHDARERPSLDIPEFVDIPLRDYQEEAVQRALASRGVLDGRGVFDMPPRSGKTRTMAEVVRRLAIPTIWIAPTDRIVVQTHNVLKGFFGENYAMHLVGAQEENVALAAGRRVVVCTAATAVRLPAEFFRSRQCAVVDEFHHGAAPTYRKIFSQLDHCYYRFGMTGTFLRSGEDELAMYALLSNTIYKITSMELLRRGYLVPTYVVFVPVAVPRLRGMDGTFQTGHGKHGIHEHAVRQQLVSHTALYLWETGRKTIILVGTKKQGNTIRNILHALLPKTPASAQFQSVEFISTDVKRPRQGPMLRAFEESDEVKVLIGTSLLGEGVDLPSADALVYARGEKGEVSLLQNSYRPGTAIEGKRDAILVDFGDRHHRKLLEHSQKRLAIYYREPTFSVSVLNDAKQFPQWLKYLIPGG